MSALELYPPYKFDRDIRVAGTVFRSFRCLSSEDESEGFIAHATIAGCDFHAYFVPVRKVDGVQVAGCPIAQERLDALSRVDDPDGWYETIALPGIDGEYVLILTPFTE